MYREHTYCILIELLYRDYAGTPTEKFIFLVEVTIFHNMQPDQLKDFLEHRFTSEDSVVRFQITQSDCDKFLQFLQVRFLSCLSFYMSIYIHSSQPADQIFTLEYIVMAKLQL